MFMTWLFRISTSLFVVALAFLVVWISVRLSTNPSLHSPTEMVPFFILGGVFVAILSLGSNHRREASEEYLENAIDLLSKAYETLKNSNGGGPPKNSRIIWLTSARLIKTGESISRLITEQSHKRIWLEQKEYWRGQLRDLIFPDEDGFPKDYYAEKPEHMISWANAERTPLSLTSLEVLYRFIRWPKDAEDPLKNEPPFTEPEIWTMEHMGPKGLGHLLREVKKLRDNAT